MADDIDPVDEEKLAQILREVPSGAWALSALTVGLTVLGWLLFYVFVFLGRPSVG